MRKIPKSGTRYKAELACLTELFAGIRRAPCRRCWPLAGLFWRSGVIPMPGWLSNNASDALWALMVFVGFGFLLPRASTWTIALLALAASWGVEFSQLYHAAWLDAIRATLQGRLVLGTTFNWPDLPAYALGIMIGVLTEWTVRD